MFASSAEKVFLWIVKIGLWVIPFLPIYVSSSLLFPFITGKNFAFRIIIEIIFAFWVALAFARKEFRPNLNVIFKAVTVFVAVVFLADLFSPNSYRAFFSNYERMEGFMMIFHLYLYFVMITSVFKTKKDWMIFFHSTLAASLIVSYIALMQKLGYRISMQGGFRVDSTIGNPTYLAAYLLFHVWLALLLIYEFWRVQWTRFVYSAVLIFELIIIYFTATRGAILALVFGIILLLGALVLLLPRAFPSFSSWRKWVLGALLVAVAVPVVLWIGGEKLFPGNQIISRLSSISFTETTIQSRFNIWSMSAKAALERPILGWGQENYYLVFQKYFHPGLHSQEPWFDRSHSIIFDWLIHAGFLGLASYLAIFGAVFWVLFKALRGKNFSAWPVLVLGTMLVAYFLQNLFVFDNLNTYIIFFAILAFVQYLYLPPSMVSPAGKNNGRGLNMNGQMMAVLAVALAVAGTGIYFLNIVPIRQSRALIGSLISYQAQKPMEEIIASFQEALSYNSFGTTEVREQMSNLARSAIDDGRFTNDEKLRFAEVATAELRKETLDNAKDVKHVLFLGSVLTKMAALNPAYIQQAESAFKEALALSPSKQLIHFELAQLYLATGNINEAADVLWQAWNLDRGYKGAAANLWSIAMLAGQEDRVTAVRAETRLEDLPEELLIRITSASQRAQKFEQALEVYAVLVKKNPTNAQYFATYAALLSAFGRNAEAKTAVETAVRLDPKFEAEAKEFLRRIGQ